MVESTCNMRQHSPRLTEYERSEGTKANQTSSESGKGHTRGKVALTYSNVCTRIGPFSAVKANQESSDQCLQLPSVEEGSSYTACELDYHFPRTGEVVPPPCERQQPSLMEAPRTGTHRRVLAWPRQSGNITPWALTYAIVLSLFLSLSPPPPHLDC